MAGNGRRGCPAGPASFARSPVRGSSTATCAAGNTGGGSPPVGLALMILNLLAMRDRAGSRGLRTIPKSRWQMSPRGWWSPACGGLFVAGGLPGGLAIPLGGAPPGSTGAALAGPVFGLALRCYVGMVGIASVAGARLTVRTWGQMTPGQRRTVLLGVGAWLLWHSFWREMRRAMAG